MHRGCDAFTPEPSHPTHGDRQNPLETGDLMMARRAAAMGRPVNLRVGRYLARSARITDATDTLARWFADPERMQPLNMAPRDLTKGELKAFISSFDNRTAFLILLFGENKRLPCGIVHSEVNMTHRVARISFLSGGRDFGSRRALPTIAPTLLKVQFEKYHVEKVTAHVHTSNRTIARQLEKLGFSLEGTLRSQVRDFVGNSRSDQWLFGLMPHELRQP